MTPEQAVQAHLDVKGKTMMLMHWGGFTLAFYGWNEPIKRALKEAKQADAKLIAPKIGETFLLDSGLSREAAISLGFTCEHRTTSDCGTRK
ncbi:outer membrane romA domain protein [Desulfosporosinus sp. OT]|nr:outer membrane romA domain protein [Desulfosporosinus sp. OT]